MEEAMVMAFLANEDSDVGDRDDVEMADFWCREVDTIDGANACDVLEIDAARRAAQAAENDFMVVMIFNYCSRCSWREEVSVIIRRLMSNGSHGD